MTADTTNSHRFCVAPMLDWTDRHERYFLRLMSRRARLYTEMVTTGALIHGDIDRHLRFHESEHPIALQLGGSDPQALARCAKLATDYGYDEINLNVGCPSDRVQSGRFGACLMAEPDVVAACISAMRNATNLAVTVKSRIGIDDLDSDEFLQNFIEQISEAGCDTFIIHARIARLQGLSPKENRDIPPLNYDRVLRMKKRYPTLKIIINGGIQSLATAQTLLQTLDGVMIGREVYQNPYLLSNVDELFYQDQRSRPSRAEILAAYLPYVADQLASGTPLQHMSRHILGLYKGEPGGRLFRRHISENAFRRDASISVIEDACALAERRHDSRLFA